MILRAGGKKKFIQTTKNFTFLPYYPCIRAELDTNIPFDIEEIVFYFNKSFDYSIDIQLDDSSLNTWRPLIRYEISVEKQFTINLLTSYLSGIN